MTKKLLVLTALVFGLSATPALANEPPASIERFAQGLAQVLSSPIELFKTPHENMQSAENKGVGLLQGILKAPFEFVKEAGHGLVKAITFPVENSAGESMESTAMDRLSEGFKEIFKSPAGLVEEPKDTMDMSDNQAVGVTKGILKAPFRFLEKLGHGIINVLTFPAE